MVSCDALVKAEMKKMIKPQKRMLLMASKQGDVWENSEHWLTQGIGLGVGDLWELPPT